MQPYPHLDKVLLLTMYLCAVPTIAQATTQDLCKSLYLNSSHDLRSYEAYNDDAESFHNLFCYITDNPDGRGLWRTFQSQVLGSLAEHEQSIEGYCNRADPYLHSSAFDEFQRQINSRAVSVFAECLEETSFAWNIFSNPRDPHYIQANWFSSAATDASGETVAVSDFQFPNELMCNDLRQNIIRPGQKMSFNEGIATIACSIGSAPPNQIRVTFSAPADTYGDIEHTLHTPPASTLRCPISEDQIDRVLSVTGQALYNNTDHFFPDASSNGFRDLTDVIGYFPRARRQDQASNPAPARGCIIDVQFPEQDAAHWTMCTRKVNGRRPIDRSRAARISTVPDHLANLTTVTFMLCDKPYRFLFRSNESNQPDGRCAIEVSFERTQTDCR